MMIDDNDVWLLGGFFWRWDDTLEFDSRRWHGTAAAPVAFLVTLACNRSGLNAPRTRRLSEAKATLSPLHILGDRPVVSGGGEAASEVQRALSATHLVCVVGCFSPGFLACTCPNRSTPRKA